MALVQILSEWTGCCAHQGEPIEDLDTLDRASDPHLTPSSPGSSPGFDKQCMIIKVTVNKPTKKAGLGLKLDITDGSHIHIYDIIDQGPVSYYNQQVRDALKIKPGDFLVSVNGVQGDATHLMDELSAKDQSILEISRPELWEVRLDKKEDETWGLGLACAPMTTSLVVTKVVAGAAAMWNLEHPRAAMKRGDRILSINGAAGSDSSRMLSMLARTNSVSFLLSRPMVS